MARQPRLSPGLGDSDVGGGPRAGSSSYAWLSTFQHKAPLWFVGGSPGPGSALTVSRSDKCNTQAGHFISDVKPFRALFLFQRSAEFQMVVLKLCLGLEVGFAV